MQATSNAAAADKKTVMEKVAEKRRALGRGLESLLPSPQRTNTGPAGGPGPGPRAVAPPAPSQGTVVPAAEAQERAAIAGEAPAPHGAVVDLQAAASDKAGPSQEVQQLPLDRILDNPNQTRLHFENENLQELAASIEVQGVLQPIVVRPKGDGNYILIMGERRLRASKMAGRTTVPAIVKRVSEQQAAEMTIIENLQRQDLDCIEQANAFSNLSLHFNLTQEEIGKRVGVSREVVANHLRLLKLPGIVIRQIQGRELSYSHARVLLRLGDEHELIAAFAGKAIMKGLTVQQLEDEVERALVPGFVYGQKQSQPQEAKWVDPNVRSAERSIEATLGMRVKIRDRKGKGKITIEYRSLEDFDRLVEMLRGK